METQERDKDIARLHGDIIATILLVVFKSDNVSFQTKCFAEVGTSDPADMAYILTEKLNSRNTNKR